MGTERTLPFRPLPNGGQLRLVATLPSPTGGLPPLPDDLAAGPRGRDFAVELVEQAWRLAGEALGAAHQEAAYAIAEQFLRHGAEVYREGRPLTWAKIIVWQVAEDRSLLERAERSPGALAHDLDIGLVTVRRRLPLLRRAIGAGSWVPRRARP